MDMEIFIALLTIIGIDIILGGDNAIVVALACRNLPVELRNKAMVLGITLAIIMRMGLTLIAVHLLSVPFLLALGGGLLTYIALQLLTNDDHQHAINRQSTTLFSAIKAILIADFIMGFDNVIAVAGAAHGNQLLVILGLIISVPIIIFGSKVILYIFDRFPQVIYIGAGILAFTASKMIIHEPMLAPLFINWPIFKALFQIALIVGILYIGYQIKNKSIYTVKRYPPLS
ncbi:TerC family protein [Alkalihalobacillus pseudalcaliphilus]|uniref:TerC family protein n=1 Tax=Alkalihalobacillus pseudalcaliphilus TaxID=79884 RepID=UPI00064DC298|nr:TerC family protein [Alkalihalobacillus pseudalcaliphilus]KMK74800.1 membrane protein [Alkalihalobacillus pseudalcaliphilus]